MGLPNAGKSSLLSRLTRAQPKVADYPFTTLEPVLGTLGRDDRQLVVADIPGLIEGASAGAGLGHEFLAHVERCRLLVHVLDLQPLDGSDPAENYETVEAELREHGHGLAELPRILALSKADLVPAGGGAGGRGALGRPARHGGDRHLGRHGRGARGAGERDLRARAAACREADGPRSRPAAAHRVYRPGRGDAFDVERTGPGAFRVTGERIDRLIARHDVGNDEALGYVEERLRALGVIEALESAGFEPGDDVEIAGIVFELDPGRYKSFAWSGPRLRSPAGGAAGCGGNDEEDAEQAVRDFATRSTSATATGSARSLLTEEFLADFSGASGSEGRDACKRELGLLSGLRVRLVRIVRTEVDGDEATVTAVIDRQGERLRQAYRLEKEDGDWKLAGAS